MVLDISGFTAITAEYVNSSHYGAEKISDMVRDIFNPVLGLVTEKGGNILLFAGDAVLVHIEEQYIDDCRIEIENHIEKYNKQHNTKLGIKTDILEYDLHPHMLKCRNRNIVYFHSDRSNADYKTALKSVNIDYPDIIKDIKAHKHRGELRAVPVFFINADASVPNDRMKPLLREIVDQADNTGIYVNKIEWLDKGWMILLSAGLPVSMEQAPVKAFRYIRKIIETAWNMGISIKTGMTLSSGYAGIIGNDVRWEYTFLGSNVNLAARIAFYAEPYQIVCDESFIKNAANLKSRHLGERTFKGFSRPVALYCAEDEIKGKKIEFIGRTDLLSKSLRHISRDNTAICITGEGGIGKSVFADMLMKRSGLKHVYVQTGIMDIPFSLITSLNKAIEQSEIFHRRSASPSAKDKFVSVFKSISQPCIIAVDDIQLIDEKSADLLKWAVYEGSPAVRFVFSGRNISKLEFLDSKLSLYDTEKVHLSGFDIEESEEMLNTLLQCRIKEKDLKNIYRISQGNPLFISQFVNFLEIEKQVKCNKETLTILSDISDFPYSLKELILVKFDRMEHAHKGFLETGSVVGEEFESGVTADASGIERTKLKDITGPAFEKKILSPRRENVLAFYHSIVRQTIYDRMLKKRIDEICIKLGNEMSLSKDPYKTVQAAEFYKIAGHEAAGRMFCISSRAFAKRRNYSYALYAVGKLFECTDDKGLLIKAAKIFEDISRFKTDADALNSLYARIEKTGIEYPDIYFITGNALLSQFRDVRRAQNMQSLYRRMNPGMKAEWLQARIYASTEGDDKSAVQYEKTMKMSMPDRETEFGFYCDYGTYSYLLNPDIERTLFAINRLKALKKHISDETLIMDYYLLMITFNIYRNYLGEVKKWADKALKLGRKLRMHSVITSLYNTYSILYNSEALKRNDPAYLRKSISMSRKMYGELRKEMNFNALPLTTANLGSTYMTSGNVVKGFEYWNKALLYAREVNHYVETPYVLAITAEFMFIRGAEKAAKKNNDEISERFSDIDLMTSVLAMKHFMTGDLEYVRKAKKRISVFLKTGHTMPGEKLLVFLFDMYFLRDDLKNLSATVKDMEKFMAANQMREVGKFAFRSRIAVFNEIRGKKGSVDKYIRQAEGLTQTSVILLQMYIAKAISTDDKAYLKAARKHAVKTRQYQYLLKIQNMMKEGGMRISTVRTENIIKKLAETGDIEEFRKVFSEL